MSLTSRSSPGFSILEALIATALAAVLGAAVLAMIIGTAATPNAAQERLDATETARSLLEEYVITYPRMEETGTYGTRWTWQIVETPVPPLQPSRYDTVVTPVLVALTLTDAGTGRQLSYLEQTVLRRVE